MRRRGFTLVELVLVLAIAAVLAAAAVPRFVGAQGRYRARLAADRVAREIEHAKHRAVIGGVSQTVTFKAADAAFTLDGVRDPDTGAAGLTIQLDEGVYRVEAMACTFAGEVLTFNGYGVPAAGGQVTITAGGYTITVTVAAETGAVSVSEVK